MTFLITHPLPVRCITWPVVENSEIYNAKTTGILGAGKLDSACRIELNDASMRGEGRLR